MKKKYEKEPVISIVNDVDDLTYVNSVNEIEISDIEDLPDDLTTQNQDTESISEMDEMKLIVFQLQEENKRLAEQMETLKTVKKVLSLEEAEIIFKRKNELLRNLRTFETTLKEIKSIGEFRISEEDPIQAEYFRIVFERKAGNRNESVFQTSNILVITEALEVVKNSIVKKVDSLKSEISTIDF